MSGNGTAPGRRRLEEVVERFPHRLRGDDGRLVAGSPLLLWIHCLRSGLEKSPEVLRGLSRHIGLPLEEMERTADFLEALLDEARVPGPLTLCQGTSCTLNGAADLRPLLLEGLEALGMRREPHDVYCLSQCEHGPSVMVGSRVYCGRLHTIIEDLRRWRGRSGGAVSISDRSLPSLD